MPYLFKKSNPLGARTLDSMYDFVDEQRKT
jgi:hypothetical protein